MEIKPYWVLIAGLLILLLFVIILVAPGPRRPHWHHHGYRPGPSPSPLVPSSNWFGPGGTRHLLGFDTLEGFASGSSDATFTMFGVDWCGHCKTAKPKFESMGPTVTIGDKVVALRFVNPEKDKASAAGYEIEGYPTFYLDYNGQRTKYQGSRDPQGIHNFLQQQLS